MTTGLQCRTCGEWQDFIDESDLCTACALVKQKREACIDARMSRLQLSISYYLPAWNGEPDGRLQSRTIQFLPNEEHNTDYLLYAIKQLALGVRHQVAREFDRQWNELKIDAFDNPLERGQSDNHNCGKP